MDLARPNMKFAVDLDKAFVLWPLCPMERKTVLFAWKVGLFSCGDSPSFLSHLLVCHRKFFRIQGMLFYPE